MAAVDVLRTMINDSEDKVESTQSQLDQVDALIEELEEQAEAIEDGQLTPIANDLEDYLENTKIPTLPTSNAEVVLGPTYNNLADIENATITDWQIIDSTSLVVLYEYLGVGWDGDAAISKFVSDWNYGHDYLIHPLDSFTGSYGIYPNIEVLNNAKSTLEGNKVKFAGTEAAFEDYV
jgi:hypothetical protein